MRNFLFLLKNEKMKSNWSKPNITNFKFSDCSVHPGGSKIIYFENWSMMLLKNLHVIFAYPNQRENNALFLISVRDIDSPETVNKFKKYEADYFRMLMGKYFSKKDPYGGKQIL